MPILHWWHKLLSSVCDTNTRVTRHLEDLTLKLKKAEEARAKLAESERLLQAKVACLESFLAIVEDQGLLTGAENYQNLLVGVKELIGYNAVKNVKCFISYTWQPNIQDNALLQAKLIKKKGYLTAAGMSVMLDIYNLVGYMVDGIKNCNKVLLISL
jgi:hypothetical protein